MLPRLIILIAFFSFLNDAKAQFFNPGGGGLMAQQCPYPLQAAPQIANYPNSDRDDFRKQAEYEREDGAALNADIKEKMAEIARARMGLDGRLMPAAAAVVIRHLAGRGNGRDLVSCGGPANYSRRPVPVPNYCTDAPLTAAPPVARQLPPEPARQQQPPEPIEHAPAIPEGQQQAPPPGPPPPPDLPKVDPTIRADNTPVECQRRPAQADPALQGNTKSAAAPTAAAPTAADPALQGNTRNSDGPGNEVVDEPGSYAQGNSVFCVNGNQNIWSEGQNPYALPGGEVNGQICVGYVGFNGRGAGIQRGRNVGSETACQESLVNLNQLYGELAVLKQDQIRHRGNARQFATEANGRYRNGRPGYSGNNGGMRSQFQNFMNTLQRMSAQNRGIGGGYPYPPNSPYPNYGAPNYGNLGIYNGQYNYGPGGLAQGGFGCNGVNNPALYGNPYLNAFAQPNWGNGAGPWGFPQVRPMPQQIRPMPGQGWPGLGGPQIRPIPFTSGFPGGFPGGMPPPGGPPPVIRGGIPGVPGGYYGGNPGYGGIPGVANITPNGIMQGLPPPTIGLNGQLGYMGANLGNWGGGAVPNSYYGGAGAYAGPGWQSNYLSVPQFPPAKIGLAPF